MKCPNCKSDIGDDSKFCQECGAGIPASGKPEGSFTKTLESPAILVNPGVVLAGRYEILEKIGEGGMGKVYRALDRNLGRRVAVKVLPDAFAEDVERLARFQREAKLLAALNHSRIAAIHGLEESGGRRFLVLELVEGATLREKLQKGPLDVEEALDLARQITDGLEAAHEKTIVHRDLKPGNIMVTPTGEVKILDFGLAKACVGEEAGADIENSPTLTARMTEPGVILGTAAYMSPEQARGRSADKRADIWAFGCVLYECLTGKRAFQGDTVSDILAHVLKGEPDWSLLPAHTPANIRTLLHRCLQKNPKNRLRDIADAGFEIDEAGSSPLQESPVHRRFPLGWVLAAGAVLVLAGMLIRPLIWKTLDSGPPTGLVASVIKLEPGYSLDGNRDLLVFHWPTVPAIAFSKDGTFIVYSASIEGAEATEAEPRLFLRRIGELDSAPIAGTEGGISPFLSPDDRWVGFWAEGKLKKVPLDGGMAQDICEAGNCLGASWGAGDRIVFFDPSAHGGLSFVAAGGGTPEILTTPDEARSERNHRLPSWLPDGRGILFTSMLRKEDMVPAVALYSSKTRKWKVLIEDAADARYTATGHLVFLRRGLLMAVPFDLARLEVTGQAVPLRSDIVQMLTRTTGDTYAGQFGISPSGSLIFASGRLPPDWYNTLAWVDRLGNDEPAGSKHEHHFRPSLSPNGREIVYETLDVRSQIWIHDLNRDISYPFWSEGRGFSPLWTPDGKKIIFGGRPSGQSASLFAASRDGSTPPEELIAIPPEKEYVPSSISPDGTRLAFIEFAGGQGDIQIYDFATKSIRPFLATEANESYPVFSPDGSWIVYCSDKEGRNEVYVSPSSGAGGAVKVSPEGGAEPLWARDGSELFYRSLDRTRVLAVDVRAGAEFSAGKPRLLFQSSKYGAGSPVRCWDISPDDQRFLMVKREERPARPITEIILIQNWFEELERLAPTGK